MNAFILTDWLIFEIWWNRFHTTYHCCSNGNGKVDLELEVTTVTGLQSHDSSAHHIHHMIWSSDSLQWLNRPKDCWHHLFFLRKHIQTYEYVLEMSLARRAIVVSEYTSLYILIVQIKSCHKSVCVNSLFCMQSSLPTMTDYECDFLILYDLLDWWWYQWSI